MGRDVEVSKLDERIREVIAAHGRLIVNVRALRDHDDLFRAGMSSHASVSVMLALEEAFDLEFPDSMLRNSTFESVSSISAAIRQILRQTQQA